MSDSSVTVIVPDQPSDQSGIIPEGDRLHPNRRHRCRDTQHGRFMRSVELYIEHSGKFDALEYFFERIDNQNVDPR